MAINLIPAVSPYLPITSILPLIFVLATSMIKEAVEDAARCAARSALIAN